MGLGAEMSRSVLHKVLQLFLKCFDCVMTEETGMSKALGTNGYDLCCKCGNSVKSNAANMCPECLGYETDIIEIPRKHFNMIYCPECERYLQPPRTWISIQLEFEELQTFYKERLDSNHVRAIREYIQTGPDSRRIIVKQTFQKEGLNGAITEEAYVVEYVVQDQICPSCSTDQANPDHCVVLVQVPRRVSHSRWIFFMEQLICEHDAAKYAVWLKRMDLGTEFFFDKRGHAVKFVEFLSKLPPSRSHGDKQLVSHDWKGDTFHYKYAFSVEVSPICHEDLICLPPEVAVSLGNLGRLVICNEVRKKIALLDPFTLRQCFVDDEQYWRSSLKAFLSSRQLVEYRVLSLEAVLPKVNVVGGSRYVLADARVARMSDLGKNDTIFKVRTHLGHVLSPGDFALGYDLNGANSYDIELDKYDGLVLPDVVLIRKSDREKPGRANEWW